MKNFYWVASNVIYLLLVKFLLEQSSILYSEGKLIDFISWKNV